MQRDVEHPRDVPEEEQTDFVSQALAQALNASLEAMETQLALLAEAEKDRAEAMAILRKVGEGGKRSKRLLPTRARDARDWMPTFLCCTAHVPERPLGVRCRMRLPKTAYKYRNKEPDFHEQWDDAEAAGVALLHAVAYKRAVIGELEPIYQGGIRVGYRRVFSDRMLELLLKGHLPAMFRESHQVEMQVSGKVKVETTTPAEVLAITQALLPKLADKIHGRQ